MLLWHRVGELLGKSVGECKATMTRRERNQWIAYLELKRDENEKTDWYLAQIAHELYLIKFMFGGKPKHKLSDFLLKFTNKREQTFATMTPAERRKYAEEKGATSRAFWEAVVGKKATQSKRAKPDKKNVLNQNKKEKKNGRQRADRRSPRQG